MSWSDFRSCRLTLSILAVAEDQYHEIISASDAWLVADDTSEDASAERELRSTNSARRIKALVEQVTGESSDFLPRSIP